MADAEDTTLSLPSVLVVLVLAVLLGRWYFASPAARGAHPPSTSAARTRPVDRARIGQVAAMFPQLDARTIAWALQQHGGSVDAVVERVLAGGNLDEPPPSFQPPNLEPPAGSTSSAAAPKPDLIQRYNLADRVHAPSNAPAAASGSGWAATKSERASLLAARRDAMILQARRNMEARVRQEKEGTAG